jgi:methionyl-tRNA formyltransferase
LGKLKTTIDLEKKNRIKFYLMGEKGFRVLEHVINQNLIAISCVVGERDPAVARDYYEEIKKLCTINNIKHIDRTSADGVSTVCDEYKLAIGWRWMLSSERLLVIHDSLLPRYRGFAPLVNCLINGETTIGATLLFASDKYDTGDIVDQLEVIICYPIKVAEAINIMARLYVELVAKLISKINNDELIIAKTQNESLATYSAWRDDEDYWINWELDSNSISRFIDAVGEPYSGARCFVNGEVAIIEDASPVEDLMVMDRCSSIGKVLYIDDGLPVIICIKGLLRINKIKSVSGASMLPFKKFRTRINGPHSINI